MQNDIIRMNFFGGREVQLLLWPSKEFVMQKSKEFMSFLYVVSCIMLAVFLVFTILPHNVYAYAADNPEGNPMSYFPQAGADDSQKTMNNNYGSIEIFYSVGTIEKNVGSINSCAGKIYVNEFNAHINEANGSSCEIGTNSGTIDRLVNNAKVTFNTGKISYNDSVIGINSGNIEKNNGKVSSMTGGEIQENCASAEVVVSLAGNCGKIIENKGKITFDNTNSNPTNLEVTTNSGNIIVKGGCVTITDNKGTVTLVDNASVNCKNNYGTITKDETAVTYMSNCANNYGTITFRQNSRGSSSSINNYYEIEFVGDDYKASEIYSETSYDGKNYTSQEKKLSFKLPKEYACTNNNAVYDEQSGTWTIEKTYIDANMEKYTVNCHKCSSASYSQDQDEHWIVCDTCNRVINKEVHTYGSYASNNDATCMKDGTKSRTCSVCHYKDTVADDGSRLQHTIVKDPRVEPTENSTGLTEGSHCSVCKAVIVAQVVIPKKEKPSGDDNKAGGNGNVGSGSSKVKVHNSSVGGSNEENGNSSETDAAVTKQSEADEADEITDGQNSSDENASYEEASDTVTEDNNATFEEENEKTHIDESQSPNEVVEKEQNSAAPIVAVVVVSIIVVAGTVAGVRAYKKK